MSNKKKGSSVAVLVGVLAAVWLASLVHPFGHPRDVISQGPLLSGATVNPSVRGILERSCQDCHSDRTKWPWYSRIAPVSWVVEKDVRDGRKDFNMSRWEQYSPERQEEILASISTLVRNNRMPQEKYMILHPEAKLQKSDIDTIYNWTHSERKRIRLQGAGNETSTQMNTYLSAKR